MTLTSLLTYLKEQKNERYRLQIVVRELQWALSKGQETSDYQTAIVAFINCLIISTPQLRDRIRIRNEFIGKYISNISYTIISDNLFKIFYKQSSVVYIVFVV